MARNRRYRMALRRGAGRASDIDQLITQDAEPPQGGELVAVAFKNLSKARLIELAKERGIRANKRWGTETIISKIAAAKEQADGQKEKDDKTADKPKAGNPGAAPPKGSVRKGRKKGRR